MIENLSILAGMFEKVGVAALVIMSYRAILRSRCPNIWSGPLIGFLFGVAAATTMIAPLEVSPGVVVDVRSVMIALAALFGGVRGALVAGGLAFFTRLSLGGGAGLLPGIVSIVLVTVIAVVFLRVRGNGRDLQNLILLGLSISLSLVSIVLLPFDVIMETAVVSLPSLVARNLFGTVILGYLMAMEEKREKEYKNFKQLAERDALTGLSNRRALDLVEASALEHKHKRIFCVIMFDLDCFKDVNDNHGHIFGDLVLSRFADIISKRIRESDLVVRYGGEEFCIIVNDTQLADAIRIADDIRVRFSDHVYSNDAVITVSAGVAQSSVNASSIYTVIKNADAALYKAKDNGRNRVETHPS